MNNNQPGKLFDSLSEEQKKELLISYEESFEESNLISHEVVKLQHEKWLSFLPGTAE